MDVDRTRRSCFLVWNTRPPPRINPLTGVISILVKIEPPQQPYRVLRGEPSNVRIIVYVVGFCSLVWFAGLQRI
jgi:hypothetical protein